MWLDMEQTVDMATFGSFETRGGKVGGGEDMVTLPGTGITQLVDWQSMQFTFVD